MSARHHLPGDVTPSGMEALGNDTVVAQAIGAAIADTAVHDRTAAQFLTGSNCGKRAPRSAIAGLVPLRCVDAAESDPLARPPDAQIKGVTVDHTRGADEFS